MNDAHIRIICTNKLATNTAFGVRTDDGGQVFIPASVTKLADLMVSDIVYAVLVPNNMAFGKVPWVAVSILPKDTEVIPEPTPTPKVESVTLDDAAYAVVEESGYATTAEISKDIGATVGDTRTAMNRLFRRGRVVRADVHARPDQARPSFCMWAVNAAQFVSDGADHAE